MNYSMQGMTKTIPELFMMLKSTKVEIKKEHQVLMIDKTVSASSATPSWFWSIDDKVGWGTNAFVRIAG